jgi:methionyl-tRNA formyltransferase
MTKSKPLVFFGNERLATGISLENAPTLKALIDEGYEIKAVVSNFTPGTSRNARELEIEVTAKEHGIPVLLPEKPSEILNELAEFGAEAGILVAYGKIVPEQVINIFPKGIINIHPSLLPKYRGPTPVEQAILDGVNETGVSIMSLEKRMDAGPVFAQAKVPLNGSESKQELAEKLLSAGGRLLIENLPAILDGTLIPGPQNEDEATYCNLLHKEDGQLDPAKDDSITLERKIRAFQGFPKPRLDANGHKIIVIEANVTDNSDGAFVIPCADSTFLNIIKLIAPSGRTMSGADFKRGYTG